MSSNRDQQRLTSLLRLQAAIGRSLLRAEDASSLIAQLSRLFVSEACFQAACVGLLETSSAGATKLTSVEFCEAGNPASARWQALKAKWLSEEIDETILRGLEKEPQRCGWPDLASMHSGSECATFALFGEGRIIRQFFKTERDVVDFPYRSSSEDH